MAVEAPAHLAPMTMASYVVGLLARRATSRRALVDLVLEAAGLPRWLLLRHDTRRILQPTGAVRDRLVDAYDDWVTAVAHFLGQAREPGGDTDIDLLAFEISSLLTAGDWIATLRDDPAPLHRARTAVRRRLDALRAAHHEPQ